ncbi:hypothetical protein SteCoe_21912 [Stentor coeruleus]|uniref:Uncharacterized protein n=1 Tax=Stentor coeruleus TaxID=5963 RepID=A0A1R2BNB8_9CILI|nr:hypothetical protein SteCoe_21912 [Stentor coeruleus]
MKAKVDKNSFPSFWISPEVNAFEAATNRIITKPKHQRCNSGKVSPYGDQLSLFKLKTALKTITRKQSPSNSSKSKKSPYQSTTFKAPKSLIPTPVLKKKKVLNTKKKKTMKIAEDKLKELDKKECKKAPKIYENQIFCDFYDDEGNHDRIMDTFEISTMKTHIEDDILINEAKFIISSNLETEENVTEHKSIIKPPENSFLGTTENKLKSNHLEIFAKLQNLAAERDLDEEF